MYPDVSQASPLDNPAESQRYRIGIQSPALPVQVLQGHQLNVKEAVELRLFLSGLVYELLSQLSPGSRAQPLLWALIPTIRWASRITIAITILIMRKNATSDSSHHYNG